VDNSKAEVATVDFLSNNMRQVIRKVAISKTRLQFNRAKCPCMVNKIQEALEATSRQLQHIL
jgi:hypothetical protein